MAEPSAIPWNTPEGWQAANASLVDAVRRNRPALAAARRSAGKIRQLLDLSFPVMDDLCRQTCPACTDVCCRRAWVWIDFTDLLFLHLAEIQPPVRQLLRRRGDHCGYAGPDGCCLQRMQRPFVCTWYLCPDQTRLLTNRPTEKKLLAGAMEQIKGLRKQMETAFIQALI